ncbi:hypothetical protein H0H87_001875 [Tephrocybe sp. NHM501043]|nr:hypothetical protein H0H87_001875 [Tephrocybe sp. NHM501043]
MLETLNFIDEDDLRGDIALSESEELEAREENICDDPDENVREEPDDDENVLEEREDAMELGLERLCTGTYTPPEETDSVGDVERDELVDDEGEDIASDGDVTKEDVWDLLQNHN